MDSIQQAIRLYKGKGHEIEGVEFKDDKSAKPIHKIMADNEFQVLKEELE
jgi:hypothetical protein